MTWGVAVQGDGWGVIGFDTLHGAPGWKGDESTGSKIDQVGDVFFGWAGAGSRDGHTIESSLNKSLEMTEPNIRALYGYIDTIHAAAQKAMAKRPDGPVRMAQTYVEHPQALMLFTRPEPTIARMLSPDNLTIASSPGWLFAVPIEYEAWQPPGATWKEGRLTALRWLHQQGAQYPLEAVTVHDGTVTRDWLASEHDLLLLERESA